MLHKPTSFDLFPEITPYSSGYLDVDDTHNVYWEQSGNPEGVPVLFLHGGPGAGASAVHRRFFDPEFYRIIIFDQRGCGRSQPLGCLENNTPQHLVSDIEALRAHLGLERWHLFGGSWGATLSLLYATQYPERVCSMILRGIFLNEQREIDWFLYGMKTVFPEAWERFAGLFPEAERHDLLTHYYAHLTSWNEDEQIEAGIRWSRYEGACASLLPNNEIIESREEKRHALALARLEAHYFLHHAISEEDSLLNYIKPLHNIPAIIVQGRYDIICPIETAYRLHKVWPEAEFAVVAEAGHAALDPPLRSRLIEATEQIKTMCDELRDNAKGRSFP